MVGPMKNYIDIGRLRVSVAFFQPPRTLIWFKRAFGLRVWRFGLIWCGTRVEIQPVDVGAETQHESCKHLPIFIDPLGPIPTFCGKRPTIHCQIDANGTVEDFYYCQEHCHVEGFCYGCGRFFAGIESFDFAEEQGGIKGLCGDCEDQFRADTGEGLESDEAVAQSLRGEP